MTRDEAQRRMDEGDTKGWVYLIEAGAGGSVKIGWSLDPEARMDRLQTGHPELLTLLAVIPGTRHLEIAIHRKLRPYRQVGEWFERGQALRLLRPIIAEHGLKLASRAVKSRNSPEVPAKGKRERREFVVELQ